MLYYFSPLFHELFSNKILFFSPKNAITDEKNETKSNKKNIQNLFDIEENYWLDIFLHLQNYESQ